MLPNNQIHPLDIAEAIAVGFKWERKRAGDELYLQTLGEYCNYDGQLIWSEDCRELRIALAFDFKVSSRRHISVLRFVNDANMLPFNGAFAFCIERNMMVMRSVLLIAEDYLLLPQVIEETLSDSVDLVDRFYLPFQLIGAGRPLQEARYLARHPCTGHA